MTQDTTMLIRATWDQSIALEKERVWPAGLSSGERLLDCVWIVFLFFATSAGFRFGQATGIDQPERLVWLAADLAVAVAVVLRHGDFLRLARKNAIFLVWAAVASISALWSIAPGISLYHGVQLLLTIMVGGLLCIYADLMRILQLLFVALMLVAVSSILYVIFVPSHAYFHTGAWQGVFGHKNQLGNIMALQIITGMCLFMQGWRPILSAMGTAIATIILFLSESGTAIVVTGVMLIIFPLVLAFRRSLLVLTVVIGVLTVCACVVLMGSEVNDINLISAGLAGLGKDDSLSGRTLLWDFGVEAFESRPWLGFGYKAWWEAAGAPVAVLRIVMGQSLWFFHNSFLELAVAFGYMGPVLLSAGLAFAFVEALRRLVREGDYVAMWPVMFVVQTFVACFAEFPLFVNHSLSQVLFVAAVSARGSAASMSAASYRA